VAGDGFLNLNKPSGITSYDVIRRLKPLLPATKIGHLGTLDPLAAGVLPIAVGRATRLIEYIEDNTKEYEARMILGGVSDTQDCNGNISFRPCELLEPHAIQAVMREFIGDIWQVPPMFSAVHHQGRRLYELARKGLEVQVKPRRVKIYDLRLISLQENNGRQEALFHICCSAGTYVRTICHDMGQRLGCGAYLNSLTRSRSGPFKIENAHDLDSLVAGKVPIASAIQALDFPLDALTRITVEPALSWAVMNGRPVVWPGVEEQKPYLLYDPDGVLLAVARGQIRDNQPFLQPEKVLTGGKN